MLDIYFKEAYGKICEYVDGGHCEVFDLKTDNGYVRNMFMKRPVPYLIDGVQYYDIVTPYGYGGPILVETVDHDALIADYNREFRTYCLKNGIVSEFIRWHPIYNNHIDFDGIYENIYSRHTVGTDLHSFEDPVQAEFSKTARREMRKAAGAGVTCTVNPGPENLDVFRRLYEETMDRNHASEMYYFPDSYYQLLTTELRPYITELQAHYNGMVIASEIYFTAGDLLHAHLLGSNQTFLELSAGTLLEATAAAWGKENGYRYIHHGGGRSSSADDALYLYKKKFGKHTEFEFYIGKKIWIPEIYDALTEMRERNSDKAVCRESFFPAYRA